LFGVPLILSVYPLFFIPLKFGLKALKFHTSYYFPIPLKYIYTVNVSCL